MKNRILVVDDEWNMRNLIKIYLSGKNFQIDEATNGHEAIDYVCNRSYDLLILDIMMPEIDGWQVCKTIREFKDVPILMLTARDDVKDRVQGLNMGADDYLVKPFAPEELVARMNALIRRNKKIIKESEEGAVFELPELIIKFESREVKVKDKRVDLTPKEFNLLYLIAKQPKRVFTRDMLLNHIWSVDDFRDLRTVDTHVKNVRDKLRKAGISYNAIKTVWGVGYRFNEYEEET
ncbi:response regulator transcription factor [Pseudalkalibacillus sp. A8]|uniref:response regulator transcription factor n=1 Tax=Pseudalkalibacillus sp. A8 TaxID=3382641 RepID=UPI0038B4CA7F